MKGHHTNYQLRCLFILSLYCGISRIREGEFSRIAVFSEVINSRIAVVREMIGQCGCQHKVSEV